MEAKMRIKIINPNTTQSMTNGIYDAAMRVKNNETEIVAVTPHCGPESIENFHDIIVNEFCRSCVCCY